jgi:membrane protease YdiL (CAAX protease family)
MKIEQRHLLAFFVLVFVLSIPFWILGSLFEIQLLPGLPIGAFAVFVPGIATGILAYRSAQFPAVSALVRRSFDGGRITKRRWYIIFFFFNPAVAVISFLIMRVSGGGVPNPPPLTFAVFPLAAFSFIAAIGEELGWTGYATKPSLQRWGPLLGSILLGLVWAAFHVILLAQVDRSLQWIAWWSLGTVSLRTIMIWLYRHAGESVLAAAIFHATINISWQLFPVNGSFYDPKIFSLVTIALGILMVARWRLASQGRMPAA